MRDRLRHRGPDGCGEWRDPSERLWLGHRRLSILDLSDAGAQPMVSANGRYVITYNGEVYNHEGLRGRLEREGAAFKSRCDTEVMLAAIERWGLRTALDSFIGMFAFGLWDRQDRILWLCRDRMGIKPLYYTMREGALAFASELQALDLPWVDREIDLEALSLYFHTLVIPAPLTILRGVRKLSPGCLLRWDGRSAAAIPYWSLESVAREGHGLGYRGTFGEAAEELEALLTDAVRMRLVSDVPVGAFLSGGVDSSLVAALMQKVSARPVQTFTIGFEDRSHNEADHARAVARHLKTEHHEHLFTAEDVRGQLTRVAELHDEPFGDVSSLPTYLLSATARRQVTVALSGDGGDELFGGYPRYFWAERIGNMRRRLGPAVGGVASLLKAVPRSVWDGPVNSATRGRIGGAEGLSGRIARFADYLATPRRDVYRRLVSVWQNPERLIDTEPSDLLAREDSRFADLPWAEEMMARDQMRYLPDDILTKVDRTSMAVSLEVRVPLLDHRVVAFAWRIPSSFKLARSGDRGKLLLREVLYRHIPRGLIERPKMGFGIPLGRWLRGELRDWTESMLDPAALRSDGLLNAAAVQRAWREHLAGADRQQQLWTVLLYLEWRRSQRARDCRLSDPAHSVGVG